MATLILEDGTRFEGTLFGYKGNAAGEVVFTTGMAGYQETLTDPACAGQIVCMTYPLIGNVGVNDLDFESECGNCAIFCPYDSAPYRDKFTLFMNREGFDESVNNAGFLPLGGKKVLVRLDGKVMEVDLNEANDLPADIEVFILTVLTKYAYLIG